MIADDVGLGKTLQAGILTSELIRRGRGKRILVVTSKSMLVQFQKEFWTRFSIPLTRLDSEGIKKVQTKIPDNHNPFQYFDRTIISIDTLKSTYYSNRIREAWWDIIIIDEAQNVAERKGSKGGRSFRNLLAKNLSSRSDSLILLSATPHDGSKRSFASLMRMLDPTSIADPENYGPEDIKGLFIRRFRTNEEVIRDIRDVGSTIPERETIKVSSVATAAEENAYDKLDALELHSDSKKVKSSQLVKITLEKALFSSPCACIESIENRIKRIESQNSKKEAQEDGADKLKTEESNADLKALRDFHVAVKAIGKENFSKYAKMLEVLKEINWTGKDKSDRLVIFTERIATLDWLVENLQKDLKLSDKEVVPLHGMMKDIDIQEVVDDFGQENKPVRILVASDLASEGINLHHQSHKLIHFDIPWSLMTFQQRNGRIDRYGQESQPKMWYMLTESKNSKIQGDQRILEILIEKNENAEESIGDPSVFFGTNDVEEQEDQVADAIHQKKSAEDFSMDLDKNQSESGKTEFSELEMLINQQFETTEAEPAKPVRNVISGYSGNNYIFPSVFDFTESALNRLKKDHKLEFKVHENERSIDLAVPTALYEHGAFGLGYTKTIDTRWIPKEAIPEDYMLRLTDDQELIKEEIKKSRMNDESSWSKHHYLWEINPLVEWLSDQTSSFFNRNEAPVMQISGQLEDDESIFIINGVVPNRKGHILIDEWVGVRFKGEEYISTESLSDILTKIDLTQPIPNTGQFSVDELEVNLPTAVERARDQVRNKRNEIQAELDNLNEAHLELIEELKDKHLTHIENTAGQQKELNHLWKSRYERILDETEKMFKEYWNWLEETQQTEDDRNPYVRIVAVLKG